jgi:TonB family protein
MKFLRTVAFSFAALCAASCLSAQLPKTDGLAAKMADAISKSDPQSAIVFDFRGPGERLNALGQYLGQNFSHELAEQKRSFSILDPDKIPAFCEKQKFSSSAVRDSATAAWIGEELGAKAVVVGQLSITDDKLEMDIVAYRTKTRTPVVEFKSEIPLNDDMRALVAKDVEYISRTAESNVPAAGKNGFGFPECILCPAVEYDPWAESEHIQGTVALIATIEIDGKAHNMVVTKALGYGLTEKAIETVSSWTFKPATGPNGQPTEVRQTVEISFHLNW